MTSTSVPASTIAADGSEAAKSACRRSPAPCLRTAASRRAASRIGRQCRTARQPGRPRQCSARRRVRQVGRRYRARRRRLPGQQPGGAERESDLCRWRREHRGRCAQDGDGGKVIVWADEATQVYGDDQRTRRREQRQRRLRRSIGQAAGSTSRDRRTCGRQTAAPALCCSTRPTSRSAARQTRRPRLSAVAHSRTRRRRRRTSMSRR